MQIILFGILLLFTLGILLLFTSGIAVAGPFGFSNDSAPSSIHCQQDDSLFYRCNSAPKAHPAFEFYMIQYHSDLGVCFLKAIGKDIDTNSFGSGLTAQTNKIKNQIASKYGPPTQDYNQVMTGSIWTEPEDFMMSLVKKERIFYIEWEVEKREHVFDTIAITIKASRTNIGYLNVEYYYPNSDKCDEVAKKEKANSF